MDVIFNSKLNFNFMDSITDVYVYGVRYPYAELKPRISCVRKNRLQITNYRYLLYH